MSSSKANISIIIPSYNRARLLKRSIESILSQSYSNFEVIVVDDASSDDTTHTVKSFKDKRVKLITHAENKGGAAARNTGIQAATGKLIAFQDSDDVWKPDKLEKQMNALRNCSNDFGAVYCGYLLHSDKGEYSIPPAHIKNRDGEILQDILAENFIGTPTLLVRRNVFEQVGLFDESLPRFQDWDMAIRIAKDFRFCFVNETLVTAHMSADSISQTVDSAQAWENIFVKHFDLIKKDSRLLAKHYGALGHLHCLQESWQKGFCDFVRSITVSPFYGKAWGGLICSLFGCRAYKYLLRMTGRI